MSKSDIQISKFLSLVLRHKPDTIGITLDASGWVDVDVLLSAMANHGQALGRDQLQSIVDSSDKQRFALSEDLKRIRANQGHSVGVDLGYQVVQPPELLYHGTVEKFLAPIAQQGILKGTRHKVHLSLSLATTTAVGARRGSAVILTIRSGQMHRDGFTFELSANDVWLTETVPPRYIVFPQSD